MYGYQSFSQDDEFVVVKQLQLDHQIHDNQNGVCQKDVVIDGQFHKVLYHAKVCQVLNGVSQHWETVGEKADTNEVRQHEQYSRKENDNLFCFGISVRNQGEKQEKDYAQGDGIEQGAYSHQQAGGEDPVLHRPLIFVLRIHQQYQCQEHQCDGGGRDHLQKTAQVHHQQKENGGYKGLGIGKPVKRVVMGQQEGFQKKHHDHGHLQVERMVCPEKGKFGKRDGLAFSGAYNRLGQNSINCPRHQQSDDDKLGDSVFVQVIKHNRKSLQKYKKGVR